MRKLTVLFFAFTASTILPAEDTKRMPKYTDQPRHTVAKGIGTNCRINLSNKLSIEQDTIRKDYIDPKYYLCHYTKTPLSVDGILNEQQWKSVPWTENFVDIFIRNKKPPLYNTKVKMLWDETYFYFAAEMKESHIRAEYVTRDTVICLENDFEIFFDPNGDNHEYFEFEMNALGTVWDLFLSRAYRDSVTPDNGWDIKGLLTGIKINGTLNNSADLDKNWITEIAIPWTTFGEYARMPCPPLEDNQWRVNFLRVEYEPKILNGKYYKDETKLTDNSVWSPHQSGGMHDPESFGIVQFTRKPFGQGKIIPDTSVAARSILMQIYFAQKKYFAEYKRYANSIKELGLVYVGEKDITLIESIEIIDGGYIAAVEIKRGSKKGLWHINQVSKIWHLL